MLSLQAGLQRARELYCSQFKSLCMTINPGLMPGQSWARVSYGAALPGRLKGRFFLNAFACPGVFYHGQSPFCAAARAAQAFSWAWFTSFNQRGSQARSLFGVHKYADKLSSQMRTQLLDFVRPKGLENMIKFHSNKKKWSRIQERKAFRGEKSPPVGFQAAPCQIQHWGYEGLRRRSPSCPHVSSPKTSPSSPGTAEPQRRAPRAADVTQTSRQDLPLASISSPRQASLVRSPFPYRHLWVCVMTRRDEAMRFHPELLG